MYKLKENFFYLTKTIKDIKFVTNKVITYLNYYYIDERFDIECERK